MLNSAYSLTDGVSLNFGESEAEGVGMPISANVSKFLPAANSSRFSKSAETGEVYEAFLYGFHSDTVSREACMDLRAQACGYLPYGMAGD